MSRVRRKPVQYRWLASCASCGFQRHFALVVGVSAKLQSAALLEEAGALHERSCPGTPQLAMVKVRDDQVPAV